MKHIGKSVVVVDSNKLQIALHEEEWNKVNVENQQILIDFDNHSKQIELRDTTRVNNFRTLLRLAKGLQKSLREITKIDINNYFDLIDVGNITKQTYFHTFMKFFRWLDKIEVLDDIKDMKRERKHKKFSEMLTEEELLKLIDFYRDPCEKALVAVFCDSSCRRGEIANLKRKDVKIDHGQWSISVDGKTGVRPVPLVFSQKYLEDWFNKYHPYKEPDAPLWIARSNRLKFKSIEQQALSTNAIWRIVKKGENYIGKHLHPHLLRHSRLSNLAEKGLPEYMMRAYAGWTPGSNMTATYLHTNPKQIADKLRNISGASKQPEPVKSKLIPKECPRCNNENIPTAQYCSKCWLPLDVAVAMDEMKIVEMLRSKWYKTLVEDIKVKARSMEIPYEQVEPKALVKHYEKLMEDAKRTPEERKKRLEKEIEALVG